MIPPFKVSTFFLAALGALKMGDFGIAKVLSCTLACARGPCGPAGAPMTWAMGEFHHILLGQILLYGDPTVFFVENWWLITTVGISQTPSWGLSSSHANPGIKPAESGIINRLATTTQCHENLKGQIGDRMGQNIPWKTPAIHGVQNKPLFQPHIFPATNLVRVTSPKNVQMISMLG